MNFQDWNVVSWDKRGEKNKNESKKTYINNQIRQNNVISQLKNKSLKLIEILFQVLCS